MFNETRQYPSLPADVSALPIIPPSKLPASTPVDVVITPSNPFAAELPLANETNTPPETTPAALSKYLLLQL